MKIQRRISTLPGRSMHALLLTVGYPLRRAGVDGKGFFRGGIWRAVGDLDLFFYDVRKCYLEQIKQAHPDRGGSVREAASITAAFGTIKERIKRRQGLCVYRQEAPL